MNRTGILLIDKPPGLTSHDVVDEIRKLTGVKKVGHAGTLDPAATGLLVVLVGRSATRLSDKLRGTKKTYILQMKLGITTDTLDLDGEIIHKLPSDSPKLYISKDQFETVVNSFHGTYQQQVPWFSAVKVDGKKLYELARSSNIKNHGINPPKRKITIHGIKLLDFQIGKDKYPSATIETTVSSGTYTRAIVRDIGQKLDVPTVQTSLRRIQQGKFSIEQANSLKEITTNNLIKLSDQILY